MPLTSSSNGATGVGPAKVRRSIPADYTDPVMAEPDAIPEARPGAGLVPVHRCGRAEALVVKGLLESDGVPVVLRSRLTQSVYPFTIGDQGEVTVLVPAGAVTRALLRLARIVPDPSLL